MPEQTGKSIFQVASRLTQFVFGLLHPLLRLTLSLTQLLAKGLELQHQGILGVCQTQTGAFRMDLELEFKGLQFGQ